ncbi:hypothetical protein HPP92_005073 [Vanilla planifolia]|uniref:Uncharacterized protein n=1 Tax=Vanilla planifolia TaxID=51239 RepID=A0A835VB02_VANPL|nr:hypothetical protein HPP92_005073 [Vanilla planifolia]
MREAKTGGDFTVMEVSPHTSFGVRTRAKTLALQRLQNTSPTTEDSLSYLQLRSRRLEKVLQPMDKPEACKEAVRSSPIPNPSSSASAGMGTVFGARPLSRLFVLQSPILCQWCCYRRGMMACWRKPTRDRL